MPAAIYRPGDFEPSEHFYPRVLNAQLHPLVRHFLNPPVISTSTYVENI